MSTFKFGSPNILEISTAFSNKLILSSNDGLVTTSPPVKNKKYSYLLI